MSFKNLKNVRICIFGMGHVGLPLACGFLKAGCKVTGVDVVEEVVRSLNNGISHIRNEPGVQEILEKNVKNRNFKATTDGMNAVEQSDVVIIVVPLTVNKDKNPNFDPLKKCCKTISKRLKKGHLICFETTLPPGTTNNLLIPLLEESGLKAGTDFYVASCPERAMSGRVLKDLESYPKIIGGINRKSGHLAGQIYELVFSKGVILVKNTTTAEAIKIFEGIYRDVNIGLANELMMICQKHYNVDIKEVIKAANSQPFCHVHEPGIGVGGICMPVYPYFLINKFKEDTKIIRNARKTNENMPKYFVDVLIRKLKAKKKNIKKLRVCVLGLSFRPNVKEHRYSPTFDVVKELKKLGAIVSCYDPLYKKNEIMKILKVNGYDNLKKVIDENEALIIATGYEQFRNQSFNGKIVVDGRFILKNIS